MNNETGTPARGAESDQAIARVGEKVRDLLSEADLLPDSSDSPAPMPSDIGRLVCAFVHIRDPRIRTEFVCLIEALKNFSSR